MVLESFIQFELTPRFMELLQAPFSHPDMIWMTLPLLVSTLLLQIYFGRYKNEKIGWNTALSNSLVLFFVGVDSVRFLIDNFGVGSLFSGVFLKTLVVVFVVSYGLLLAVFDFFHKIPSKLAFIISSPATVNILAYLNLAIIYSDIPLDFVTVLASSLIFLIFFGACAIIRWIVPDAS
ncbi:MAG: hypothetical protein GON13_03635 [Nanoarchaeota archaeon]|nr:hypothetical protein [Nanoarchaeota archaeon]